MSHLWFGLRRLTAVMPSCRLILPVLCLLAVSVVDGGPVSKGRTGRRNKVRVTESPASTTSTTVSPVYPPYTRCNNQICDLRTHYCDEVIMRCSLCSEDCDPLRIGGNEPATDACKQNCGWYYLFSTTPPTATMHAANTTPHYSDDWAINGDKTLAFLMTSLLIAVGVILMFTITVIIYLGVRAFTNQQTGSRRAVCMDASSHCRLVDDSKLLPVSKNLAAESPDSNLPVTGTTSAGSDVTSPKVADVHRSNAASLTTNTSLDPLLRSRP